MADTSKVWYRTTFVVLRNLLWKIDHDLKNRLLTDREIKIWKIQNCTVAFQMA